MSGPGNSKDREIELLKLMNNCYAMLRGGSLVSPYAIRSVLLDAEAKGVKWDSVAYGILDCACQRAPTTWNLTT